MEAGRAQRQIEGRSADSRPNREVPTIGVAGRTKRRTAGRTAEQTAKMAAGLPKWQVAGLSSGDLKGDGGLPAGTLFSGRIAYQRGYPLDRP